MFALPRRTALPVGALVLALTLAACGSDADTGTDTGNGDSGGNTAADGGGLSGDIAVDGSSTVTPLTEPAAELFMAENPDVRVAVGTSGTGGGFEKFCNGETDISMASRQIKQEEIDACAEAGIEYDELGVANDGLAVVVNPENDWATCLSVDAQVAQSFSGFTTTARDRQSTRL